MTALDLVGLADLLMLLLAVAVGAVGGYLLASALGTDHDTTRRRR